MCNQPINMNENSSKTNMPRQKHAKLAWKQNLSSGHKTEKSRQNPFKPKKSYQKKCSVPFPLRRQTHTKNFIGHQTMQ